MEQKEYKKNHTLIDNGVLEHLAKLQINGIQSSVLFCVIRATYGFHKETHELSLTYIANNIGRSKNKVADAVNKLIDRNVLKVYQRESMTGAFSRELGINNNYKTWIITKRGLPQVGDTLKGVQQVPQKGGDSVPQLGHQKIVRNSNINSSRTPDVSDNYNDPLFLKFWEVYPRKYHKQDCFDFWLSLNVDNALLQNIIDGVNYFVKNDWVGREQRYIPSPKTFLEDEQWKSYRPAENRKDSETPTMNENEQLLYFYNMGLTREQLLAKGATVVKLDTLGIK